MTYSGPERVVAPQVEQEQRTERLPDGVVPVRTEVPVTERENASNDCGPMCVEMLLLADDPERAAQMTIEDYRSLCEKEGVEGTMPLNICRALSSLGYENVTYFSTIQWRKYANLSADLSNLPEEAQQFKGLIEDGFIPRDKLRASAEWGVENANIEERRLNWENVSNILNEGLRLVVLVGGDHYLVVTGLDQENVYFNNPDLFITLPDGNRLPADSKKQVMRRADFEEWVERNVHSTEAVVAQPPSNEVE